MIRSDLASSPVPCLAGRQRGRHQFFQVAKRLEILREVVSATTRIAVFIFLTMNQIHASATNEWESCRSRPERHGWGASCIAHAHWQPLPLRFCVLRLRVVGDEASIL